jgi:hypothetical protein
MVDALRQAHRRLRDGGLLIDARPDGPRRPRILARGRVRTYLGQTEEVDADDAAADAAVAKVVAAGLFRPIRSGGLWYRVTFRDLAELDEYVRTSSRYGGYLNNYRAPLVPFRNEPLVMRRAMQFTVFARR